MQENTEGEKSFMEIKGRCKKIENRDKQNGFATFLFECFDDNKTIRAIGPMAEPKEMQMYVRDVDMDANGFFRFGYSRPFSDCKAESIEIISKAGIGINEKTAKAIVDRFGDDVYAYGSILGFKEKLMEFPGIGEKKAQAAVELVRREIRENNAFRTLSMAGIPYTAILAYLKEYGARAEEEIIRNPYGPMKFDAGFSVCDSLARKSGVDTWDMNRVMAAITETLHVMESRGHTRLPLKNFLQLAAKISGIKNVDDSKIPEKIIEWTVFNHHGLKIYTEESQTYLSTYRYFQAEETIASNLKKLMASSKKITDNVTPFIEHAEKTQHTSYTDEQKQVFGLLENGGIKILSGGPGTGKTTTIAGLVEAFYQISPKGRVLLCAPTGRAAARMSEISRTESKTMHKAMNLKWYDGMADATPLDYDLIIVDEMSMADTLLFSIFTSMIKPGTALLLSGDYNQLPSVAPGQIFRDLIESGIFDVCRLTKIIRQGEGSLIKENAYRILNAEPVIQGKDFIIRTAANDNELLSMLDKYTPVGQMPQILCPIKKTGAGTYAVNRMIQGKFGFKDYGIWLDGTCFHVEDWVIMNNNNYEAGYMNGDVGMLEKIQDGYATISFETKKLILDISQLDGMDLSYALTVHKSQGSECDEVLLLLPSGSVSMASRELAYTAITRAKKKVVILEVKGMLDNFLNAEGNMRRNCGLLYQLKETNVNQLGD